MSSVKQLKSKGRADTGKYKGISEAEGLVWRDDVAVLSAPTLYDYRRAAFAGLPPAKTVRPMRVVRARVAEAHAAVDRAIQAGVKAGLDWAGIGEATVAVQGQLRSAVSVYKQARRAAQAGRGHIVHLAAA